MLSNPSVNKPLSEVCEICNNELFKPLITKDETDVKLSVYKCDICGVKKFVFSISNFTSATSVHAITELFEVMFNKPKNYMDHLKESFNN